jgi:hypothetical protein
LQNPKYKRVSGLFAGESSLINRSGLFFIFTVFIFAGITAIYALMPKPEAGCSYCPLFAALNIAFPFIININSFILFELIFILVVKSYKLFKAYRNYSIY